MKKYLYYLTLFVFTSFLFVGCSSKTEEDNTVVPGVTKGTVDLTVHVIDNTSSEDIGDATVIITGSPSSYEYSTNGAGNINLSFENDKSRDLTIITIKKGYYTDTTRTSVGLDDELTLTVKLQEKTVNSDVTGPAATIVLISTSSQNVGVKESGSIETANILFEVQDSSGNPINMSQSVFVSFRFGVHPGGGEFLGPDSTKTNAQGRVYVNLNSGYKAGPVQVHAEIQPNGRTINKKIISKPVNISIHGGFPDQNHFSIGVQYFNIHGWSMMNVEDKLSAIVGDKFANPAKPKTSVYFTTTGGIVEGSTLTDVDGRGTVTLISGNPRPVDPILGPGYARIIASTADENQNKVTDSATVVFSGPPIVTITEEDPNQRSISHLGSKVYNFTIKDVNGNPISSFHRVRVIIRGEGLSADGDVDFQMPDALFSGPGTTDFSFVVTDNDKLFPLGPRTFSVSVVVTGPYAGRGSSLPCSVDPE